MKKIIISLILFLSIISTGVITFAAPYKGYTYNQWGSAVPSPNGYIPEKFVSGRDIGTEDFRNPQDLFVDQNNKNMYIADSGNNRIVIIDSSYNVTGEISELKTSSGETDSFNDPSGIFVDGEGLLYVADTRNGRIIKCDREGNILKIIGEPVNPALGENFRYLPMKLVVDSDGLIYIQAQNVFQGLICMDQEGRFIQFFGANLVDITPQVLFEQTMRRFMSRQQREGMVSLINIEYSNLFIDQSGFIFAVVSKSQNSLNQIKKINSKGDNVLRVNPYSNSANYFKNSYGDFPILYLNDGTMIETTFNDIHYDEKGFISALDRSRGRVFVYDDESNLMFVFGTLGDQLGSFQRPVALDKFNDEMIVLDSVANGFTIFKRTEFGEYVEEAISLYNEGKYMEAVSPWEEVIKRNSNYNLAYIGLGKAYLRLEDYQIAMKYFKIGYDKPGYSDAKSALFVDTARANMPVVFIAMILFAILPFVLPSLIRKGKNFIQRRKAA